MMKARYQKIQAQLLAKQQLEAVRAAKQRQRDEKAEFIQKMKQQKLYNMQQMQQLKERAQLEVDSDAMENEGTNSNEVVDYSDLSNLPEHLKNVKLPESTSAVKKLKLNQMKVAENKKLQQRAQAGQLVIGSQALDTMTVTGMHALEGETFRQTHRGAGFDVNNADVATLPKRNFRIKNQASITPERMREQDPARLNAADEAKAAASAKDHHQPMFHTQTGFHSKRSDFKSSGSPPMPGGLELEAMKQQVQKSLKGTRLVGNSPLATDFQEYMQIQAGNSRVKRTIVPKFVNSCNTIKVDLK